MNTFVVMINNKHTGFVEFCCLLFASGNVHRLQLLYKQLQNIYNTVHIKLCTIFIILYTLNCVEYL